MIRWTRWTVCWLLLPAWSLAAEPANVAGVWSGKLAVGGISLTIVFDWKQEASGQWSGTLDSPDQGAFGIPVTRLEVVPPKVICETKSIGGQFEGKLDDAGVLRGEWKQGGQRLKLDLRRGEKAPRPARPQEPKEPFPYGSEDVVYDQPTAKIRLAGTLTIPAGQGPFPAVLLISGSGPQDRNEELLGHKPFWVLADYLSRRGIAVLRVDDRGVGKSTGDFSRATTADFVEDALAGVAFLKSRSEVNAAKIGLIGHSEGGLIAPAVAVKSPDVAFIVMLAGPGVNGEQIVLRQGDLISAAAGVPTLARMINQQVQKKLFAILRDQPDEERAAAEIRTTLRLVTGDWLSLFHSATPAEDSKKTTDPVEVQVKTLTSPWFRYFLTYEPRPALEKVRCPVLVLNGEKDLQVAPRQNLPEIEAALRAGQNPDFTIKELPGLNHLFQACQSGSPTEYAKIEETMNPAALEAIAEWLRAHTEK